MKILEKKKLKKLLKEGHSPDEADALAMTFYRRPNLLSSRSVANQAMATHSSMEQGWLRA
jgi:hypothetical protein